MVGGCWFAFEIEWRGVASDSSGFSLAALSDLGERETSGAKPLAGFPVDDEEWLPSIPRID